MASTSLTDAFLPMITDQKVSAATARIWPWLFIITVAESMYFLVFSIAAMISAKYGSSKKVSFCWV